MELIILGSGTAAPSLTRAAPGCLLRVGGDALVLDSGPGTMRRLLRAGVRHDEVTHLLYTHNHLDHTAELAAWLFTGNIPALARRKPLTILGSAAFMRMLSSLRGLYGHWLDASSYDLTLVTLQAGSEAPSRPVAFDGWTVQAFAVSHIESSLAYRITDASGRVFAYTGDSGPCDSLIDLARDADLLLIEASTPDGQRLEGHLTPSDAGEVARRAGARKVVLTHFYPVCDEADILGQLRRVFDGAALLAEDGMKVTV